MTAEDTQPTVAEYVHGALLEAGVDLLVGLPGTQTLPLDRVVAERDGVRYLMCRHETAVPHVAWGYHEAGGGLAATLTVPGPGDTNAIHGLKNASEDSVPIVHVSPHASPGEFGKGPIHELDSATFDHVVKANLDADRPRDVPEVVERGIATALEPPTGPVRLGIPSSFMDEALDSPGVSVDPERVSRDESAAIERAADALASAARPVVIAGGGVRRSPGAPEAVRTLASALDAPVFATYKGKGTVPEDAPRFVGVTGSHLPAGGRRVLERADAVLAVGCDLDGVTTAGWDLPLGETLVQVTLDPDDLGGGYDPEVGIVADAGGAVEGITAALPGSRESGWSGTRVGSAIREEYLDSLRERGLLGGEALHAPEALSVVREALPREATVAVDVGDFRLWSMQVFEAYGPERFVATGSWAGMGVGVPAAIGASIARPDAPVACLTGDGGFMMCAQELHTAVEENLGIVVVVLNDADYGAISKASGRDRLFGWESPDFAAVAEGFGCHGATVEDAPELREEIEAALDLDDRPTVIDARLEGGPSAVEGAAYDSTVDLG